MKGSSKVVDFRALGRSEEWKQNVLWKSAELKVSHLMIEKGKHTLDPGAVLDRIIKDLENFPGGCGTIPETKCIR